MGIINRIVEAFRSGDYDEYEEDFDEEYDYDDEEYDDEEDIGFFSKFSGRNTAGKVCI